MMQQAELPLNELTVVRDDHGSVIIANWGIVVFSIPAHTLDDVRRSLRKRKLDPHHTQQMIDAVEQAGVVEPDEEACPFPTGPWYRIW